MNKKSKIIIAGIIIASTLLYCSNDEDFWDSVIPETDEQPTTSQVSGFVFRAKYNDYRNHQLLKISNGI